MGSFSEERDRVREVAANALDYREAPENQQRNEQPALTGGMTMLMRTMPVVTMTMHVTVPVLILVRRVRAVTGVMVIAVGLV